MIKNILLLICWGLILICSVNGQQTNEFRINKDYALFFAIDNYDNWKDLQSPISDSEEIARDLEDLYRFQTEVVSNPTRNEIYDKLEEYQKKIYVEDAQLFIFFSGHGEFKENSSEGFFIPRDGKLTDRYYESYIPLFRLRKIVDNIPCKHILVAIDACYSGAISEKLITQQDDRGEPKDSLGFRPGEDATTRQKRFIKNSLRYCTRLFLTSGGIERTPDPSKFAEQFKLALRKGAGEDGILDFYELYPYLRNAEPLPTYGNFGQNDVGSNFLFVLDGRSEEIDPSNQNLSNQTYQFGNKDNEERPAIRDTLKIDNIYWYKQNLDIEIPGSYIYNNDISNSSQNGRLYTYEAAKAACQRLGPRWRLPTIEEWKALVEKFGKAKGKNKFNSRTAYQSLSIGGSSRFNATLGGYRKLNGEFKNMSLTGSYWSKDEKSDLSNTAPLFHFENGKIKKEPFFDDKTLAFSCRCVWD